MSRPRHTASSFVFAATTLLAQAQEPTPQLVATIYPADTHTHHGDEVWLVTRVVDGITGAPLPHAELLRIDERTHPLRGELWFRQRVAADADGFLRVRIDASAPDGSKAPWYVVRAEGYTAVCEMGSLPGPVTALARAVDVPVRVLDARGRPVAGALLGLCGGCGHTPDLAHGVSGADGIVMLRGVDMYTGAADLYVEHPELGLAYDGLRWLPGEPPMDLRVKRAVAAHGVVVDADGQPIAGAFVGTKHVHRGPWTKTDAHGVFRLCGGDAEDDLFVHTGGREVLFERAATMPLRLQVPPPDGQPVQIVNLPPAHAEPTRTVQVQVVDAQGAPLHPALVRWSGPAPTQRVTDTWVHEPTVDVALCPGQYTVQSSADDHAATTTTVVIAAGDNRTIVLRPRALPTVEVRPVDLPANGTVTLCTATRSRDVSEQVARGTPISVPEEPFWFELGDPQGTRREFAFDPANAPVRGPLRLPWYRPTRIEGRLVDATGKPARAMLAVVPCRIGLRGLPDTAELQRRDTHGAIALTTEYTGTAYVVVQPEETPGRWQVLPVVLPPRSDEAVVDLGTVDIDAAAVVRVLDAAGEALGDARVALLRPGQVNVRDDTPPTFPLDAVGDWHGPRPQAGDALLVLPTAAEADAAAGDAKPPTDAPRQIELPVRFPVQGSGPWTFQLPGGAIELDVRGDDEAPIECTVILGAASAELRGATRLARVPAGRQRLFLAGHGRQSAIVDVDVPAQGVVTVRCRLPRR